MQIGRNLHHPGNTVEGPHPGKRNLFRRLRRIETDSVDQLKVMPFEPKLVANSTCVFCGFGVADDYMAICQRCHTCQYCGLVCGPLAWCRFCGNNRDKQVDPPDRSAKRASQSLQEPSKIKRRNVRRLSPQLARGTIKGAK